MTEPALRAVTGLDSIAEKLAAALGGRKNGEGYQAKCPCHEDSTASLSITVKNGKLLLHCHAGCDYKAVYNELVKSGALPKRIKQERRIVATYEYKDTDGTVAFEKLRYKPKDFRIRRWDAENSGWIFKDATKDAPKVLYGYPALLESVKRGDTIAICEGEKDADAFNALHLDGLFATTNFEGAKKWCPEYTKQIAGAPVVILEDNDEAGKARTLMLAAALQDSVPQLRVVRFPELPAKGDFSDWLELKERSREDIIAKLRDNEAVAVNPWLAVETATFEQHIEFVASLPGISGMRSEKLSEELYLKTESGWKPAVNMLGVIKGHARKYDCFTLGAFEDFLDLHNFNSTKELLIDVPEWDEVDRIAEISRVIRMSNVDAQQFENLIKHFSAGMFRRLKDPGYQNPTIVFTGYQGIGKDALLQALFGGLGRYLKNLDLTANREAEAMKQLHTGILFNIPEFDRTSRTEISTLKHILSTPTTDMRLSYDAREEQRRVRCSFVSSANIQHVIADNSGARRFWVFECEYMGLEMMQHENSPPTGTGKVIDSYPGLFGRVAREEEQMQLLAQMMELEREGYTAPEEDLSWMRGFVAGMVPQGPEKLLLGEWDSAVRDLSCVADAKSSIDDAALYTLQKVGDIVGKLQRDYGYSRQKVLEMLGRNGRMERKKVNNSTHRFYKAGEVVRSSEEAIPF